MPEDSNATLFSINKAAVTIYPYRILKRSVRRLLYAGIYCRVECSICANVQQERKNICSRQKSAMLVITIMKNPLISLHGWDLFFLWRNNQNPT